MMLLRWLMMGLLTAAPCLAGHALAATRDEPRVISRADYAERLHGMWLAASIGNWTGRRAEGHVTSPPFLTDEDWNTAPPGMPYLDFVLDRDPWPADDDTDIEYVYLHLLHDHATAQLDAQQITDGWRTHINHHIWVSNAVARELMDRDVQPPSTGMGMANHFWLMIDAQLTCELFGALAPGMPEVALASTDLPIRATSAGYVSHAAQYFTLLYALAGDVDQQLPPREQVLWLVQEARRYLPDSSKTADIVDFVLADYLANPDVDDWESTRDGVYERYQLHATENGFKYRGWYESSVNFACGVMMLLYGEGDLQRTIQIGTLGGWDADCATATMSGLIGLLVGYEDVLAQFPDQEFSDRYWITRTRDNMPDYLPDDPEAEDTFAMMAQRMLGVIDLIVLEAGGTVDAETWTLPPRIHGDVAFFNPLRHEYGRSANCRVRLDGGTVSTQASVEADPPEQHWPWAYGCDQQSHFANGFEQDFSGREPDSDFDRIFYSSQIAGRRGERTEQWFAVIYDRPVDVHTVRFVEGDHLDDAIAHGGWFEQAGVELRVADEWVSVPVTLSEPLDAGRPFQIVDFVLDEAVEATGVRLVGEPGGDDAFVTIAELDALATPQSFRPADQNGDGVIDVVDLLALLAAWGPCPSWPDPCLADINVDEMVDTQDLLLLLGDWG